MTTISLKLPEPILRDLELEARKRGVSKSSVIRESLRAALERNRKKKDPSCLELMGKAVGSFRGPRDLSTNRRYLKQALGSRGHRNFKNSG